MPGSGNERTRALMARSLLLFLLLLAPAFAAAVEHKCTACKAIAAELEVALANERPHKDLDLRHRLDSRGQREGRVIHYKSSELRVVELLDGLCNKMKDYTLYRSSGEWSKDGDKQQQDKQEHEAHSKAIASYCGRLLEKHEDELGAMIKNGEVEVGSVAQVLCIQLANECSPADESADEREL